MYRNPVYCFIIYKEKNEKFGYVDTALCHDPETEELCLHI